MKKKTPKKQAGRGEVEDSGEAEESDLGSWANGGRKMGQISALSFVIIPETICVLFFPPRPKFHFEVFLTFNDCQAPLPPHRPLTLSPPHPPRHPTSLSTAREVLKSFLGLFCEPSSLSGFWYRRSHQSDFIRKT